MKNPIVIVKDGQPMFVIETNLPIFEDEEAAKDILNQLIKKEFSDDFTFIEHKMRGYIYKFNKSGSLKTFTFYNVTFENFMPNKEDICPETFFNL